MKSYLFVLLIVLAVIINYTYAEDKEICDLSLISKCCSTCTPITYREYGVEEGEWCSIPYYCDEEIRYNLIIDLKDEKGKIPYELKRFTDILYTTKYSVNIKVDPSSEYKWDYQIEDTEIVQFVSKNITNNGTIERFLFVGNNVGDTKVNFTLHSLVDQEDQIQATLTYSFSVRKRFDVNKFPTIKYRKNKEIVIEEGTTYELGQFSENGVPGWSFVNSNDTVIKERKEYNKRYIRDRNAVGGGYSWVELIEGKNVGTSKFFTIFYPYSPPFSVVEFPFRVVSAKDKCFTSTNNLGYPCCEGCEILYTDDDGDWGVENEDWCGIPYHCATDITIDKKLTVPQYSTIELPIENTFNTAFSIYNSTVIDEIITYPNRTVFAGINLGKTIIRKSENNKIEKYEITVTESDESSIEETFHIKKYTRKALTFDSKYSSSYSYGWNVKIENSEIISTIQNYYSTSNEPIDQYKFVITGKNIGTSYIDFIYSFETDVDLIKKRYVIVVDEEGGDEDDEVFSGCWAEPLGYPCCTKETEIVYMDEDGNWGVENDDWCGIRVI